MSLAEVTRNCFQCGVAPSKWISLCKLFISKLPPIDSPEMVASHLSNSVLVLYRSYPGNPGLKEYLECAIEDGILPLSTFVSTLLQAARSPELDTPTTLDHLCQIALEVQKRSDSQGANSLIPYSESQIVILQTIQDGLALLRTVHTLPISQHHNELASRTEELVRHLLCFASDLSQVSVAQACVSFTDVNDLLNNFRFNLETRQMLESFSILLGLLIGDDAKVAREAQMMQSLQLALGKGDTGGPASDTDVITLGLVHHYLVSHRAHEFGAGNTPGVVTLLVYIFRWSSWTPTVFYTQLILSAFIGLTQHPTDCTIWKAFIVGRLPNLISAFEAVVSADHAMVSDWRGGLRSGLVSVFQQHDVIIQCDHTLSEGGGSNIITEENMPSSFTREFLQQFVKLELIDKNMGAQLDPSISKENMSKLSDTHDTSMDFSLYLESRLTPDMVMNDAQSWLDRIWRDAGSHTTFGNFVLKKFSSLVAAVEVESLGQLCKLLYTHAIALDIVALHVKISDLLFHALLFLDSYDCETIGDPQTAVSHLGDVVLFVQYTLAHFQFDTTTFTKDGRSISAAFLKSAFTVYPVEILPPGELLSFNGWFKAIFDSSSEGIEDTILRSTQPKTLLRISATLFSQAIKAASAQKIDKDVLFNGVSYFTGPLLNWTLVGVIKALSQEILLKGLSAHIHIEILQTLVLSSSCPQPVLALCSPQILRLLSELGNGATTSMIDIDVWAMQRAVRNASGSKADNDPKSRVQIWQQDPQRALQNVFLQARSHKTPVLDVERCLRMIPVTKFLQIMWMELFESAKLGEMESCKRIATFVLTMPRCSNVPPLLPIFMHLVLPSLIAAADRQQAQEQNISVELFVAVISSVLSAALHLECAMATVYGNDRVLLGQASSAVARRLAADLGSKRRSPTSQDIVQRLVASQSFTANFPMFIAEL